MYSLWASRGQINSNLAFLLAIRLTACIHLLLNSIRFNFVQSHQNFTLVWCLKYPIRSFEVWFGWVLWHIYNCRLFNAKYSLCMSIKYMICKHILLITFLNEPELIFFFTHTWFQVFVSNSINLTIFINPPLGQDMTQGQFLSGVLQVWI